MLRFRVCHRRCHHDPRRHHGILLLVILFVILAKKPAPKFALLPGTLVTGNNEQDDGQGEVESCDTFHSGNLIRRSIIRAFQRRERGEMTFFCADFVDGKKKILEKVGKLSQVTHT